MRSPGVRRRPLFPTQEAAHEHAVKLFKEFGRPLPTVADPEILLRDYATQWLAAAKVEKEPSTYRSYDERLQGHALPVLGHLEIRALHRSHIKAFLTAKREEGGTRRTACGS